MRRIFILLSFFISITAKTQDGSWKELNDFHALVTEVLHPVEGGNLEPLKKNSQLLLDKAILWQKSHVPSLYQSAQISGQLKELVSDCEKLNDAVKLKRSNKELSSVAMSTHTEFHKILNSPKEKH